MADMGLSWRDQLTRVRDTVVEQEKQREVEKRLEQERNEEALTKRLLEDTPEAISTRFADIQKRFDRDARRFFPLPHLETDVQAIADLRDLLNFYSSCFKRFAKVFSAQHKTVITSVLNDITELQKGLDRQLGQWREVKGALDAVKFRPRQSSDDPTLVAVAKEFSDRAHKVPLSIPGDFFSHENENFWTVESGGTVLGYIKYIPADKALTFALRGPEGVNFNKFIRGVLYKFCAEGPLPEKLEAVRVRIAFVRETKFFSDLGFVRAETKGPTEWIYQREL